MSTSALNDTAPRRSGTRLRLTRRGRAVLTTLAATPVVAAIGLVALNGGGAAAAPEGGAPAGTFDTVLVQSGDTLWGIAERVAPHADPRDVIADIQQLNQISSAGLVAGQEIAIPLDLN